MKGILVIAHGSRREQTVQTMDNIMNHVKNNIPNVPLVSSYMEFASPNVLEGLQMLKEAGVVEIIVVPYFLFEGIHIKKDIPAELEKFKAENPGISVTMTNTLGEDTRLADILSERIKEAL